MEADNEGGRGAEDSVMMKGKKKWKEEKQRRKEEAVIMGTSSTLGLIAFLKNIEKKMEYRTPTPHKNMLNEVN